MNRIVEKIQHEFKELIPVTLFFLTMSQLLAFTRSLMLKQYGIEVTGFLPALLSALVIAKVVLIADHIPIVNRFPEKPLIYNIVWKTLIYLIGAFVVRYVEHLIRFWRESASLAEANQRLLAETVWPHFWLVQLWILVLLVIFCSFRELARTIGSRKVYRMFFFDPKSVDGSGSIPPDEDERTR